MRIRTLRRAAAAIAVAIAIAAGISTPASATEAAPRVPDSWEYVSTYANIDDCIDAGEVFWDLWSQPYDCRAAVGGWDLYLLFR